MAGAVNHYGDGHAAERIVDVIGERFGETAGSVDRAIESTIRL
jgi:UDP-N-acetylglucosamine 2-epimerase